METIDPPTHGGWPDSYQGLQDVACFISAEVARNFKKARDSRAYRKMGISWDDYCKRYFGFGRSRVDVLIQQFEQYGKVSFDVCQLAGISFAVYRDLGLPDLIADRTLRLNGESIAIDAENSVQLRAAVTALRATKMGRSSNSSSKSGPVATAPSSPALHELDCLLDRFHQAASTGDASAFLSCFAPNARCLGFQHARRSSFLDLQDSISCLAGKPVFNSSSGSRHLEFSPDAATVWFDEVLVDPENRPCIAAGVAILISGEWKIAQYNLHAALSERPDIHPLRSKNSVIM